MKDTISRASELVDVEHLVTLTKCSIGRDEKRRDMTGCK